MGADTHKRISPSAFIGGSIITAICASIGNAHAIRDLTQNLPVTTHERARVRQKHTATLTFFPNLRLIRGNKTSASPHRIPLS
jgi:hypothetical protein